MVETYPEKRLIGYARVSTYGQTLDSQLEQLRAAACSSRSIYREKATGARPDRRELNRMLGKLAPGDVVTVSRSSAPGGRTKEDGPQIFHQRATMSSILPCAKTAGSQACAARWGEATHPRFGRLFAKLPAAYFG